jgi:hypothetical protein
MVKQFLSGFVFVGSLFLLLNSCGSDKSSTSSSTTSDSLQALPVSVSDSLSLQEMKDGLPIFYNMYLSVEMTRLFESAGEVYNPEILNPVEKENDYVTSNKKALNLGVYSVDLGYIRAYNQLEKSRAFFNTMRNLSSSLGIPEDFFLKSSERYDKNINNKDSLTKIANEVYTKTSQYLKENDRENASALIVLGGWVEAIYIATHMVKFSDKDLELIERIADQKYSIGNLIDMLDKQKADRPYLAKIRDLKSSFDQLNVDRNNLQPTFAVLKIIASKVESLRSEIVK